MTILEAMACGVSIVATDVGGNREVVNPPECGLIVPPRDPLNPNQATEGQPVVWASYSRDVGSLNLYYTRDFDKNWDSDLNRWGARLNGLIGDFDFSLYYFDGDSYPLLGGERGGFIAEATTTNCHS